MFSPRNTHITFPKISLVFSFNYAIFTSIIKLHFVTLPPYNTHIAFPKFSLFILVNYAIFTYGYWNVHYCINQLCNIYIPTCFFHFKIHLYVNIACVMFDMWVLHFKVKGSFKVSLEQQMLILAWPLMLVLHIGELIQLVIVGFSIHNFFRCEYYILGN
jgi:hypothetical protein